MGVSQGKLSRANFATAVLGQFVFQKILYRGALLVALLACVLCLAVAGAAQEERPQITPGERKVPRKKEAGPRALAVLQLSGNGKASLVPIAILVGGKFWDASAYKGNPVPMALEPGTVYEGERTGSSKGLFTVGTALHSNSANAPTPWLGTGNWLPAGAEVAKTTHEAETVPVGIDTSDQPPRLTKNPAAKAASMPPATAAPASTPSQPTGKSGSGDEPPRLTKPTAPASAPPGSTDPSQPPSHPSTSAPDSKSSDNKEATRPKGSESDSGADSANRPRLRRGKPVEAFAEEEVPGYSKPGAAPASAPANTAKATEAAAVGGPIQLIPAISDASGPEPHSYTFEWLKDEEGERKQQMTTYAKEQIRAYVDARAKSMITPTAPGAPAAKRKVTAKPAEPMLENVQMIAYDLWTNGQPIMVFAADAHMPPPPPGAAHAPADAGLEYTIMLVARTDIYNNLHKLFLAVTDKNHLDLTPRLELIDAVDADGDGRGELLFRETSDAGTGWVIYRASVDKLWKIFDSLNPE